jgi:hypothetical protein
MAHVFFPAAAVFFVVSRVPLLQIGGSS